MSGISRVLNYSFELVKCFSIVFLGAFVRYFYNLYLWRSIWNVLMCLKKVWSSQKKSCFRINFGLVFEYISGWCELSGGYQFEWWNEIIKSSYQIPYLCDKTDINRKTIGMPTVLRSHILLYNTVLRFKWDGFHLQMNWMQLSSASLNNDVSTALISTTMS